MRLEVVDAAHWLARFHVRADFHQRLADAAHRRGDVAVDVRGGDHALPVQPQHNEVNRRAVQQAVVAHHVQRALMRPAHPRQIGRGAVAQLAADGDLAHRLRFLGQQARAHAAGVDHHEGRAEEQRMSLNSA